MNGRQMLAILTGGALIFVAFRVPLPSGLPVEVWTTARPDGFSAIFVNPTTIARFLACLLFAVGTGVAVYILRGGRPQD